MPGQFILQYYVDNTRNKLKGSIDLDQCEQVSCDSCFFHKLQVFLFVIALIVYQVEITI